MLLFLLFLQIATVIAVMSQLLQFLRKKSVMVNIFSLPSQLYPFAFVFLSILILNEEHRQMHVDVVS